MPSENTEGSDPLRYASGMGLLALIVDAAAFHVDDNEAVAVAYIVDRAPFVDQHAARVLVRSLRNLIAEARHDPYK